jgi:hypothetical protein
MRALGLAFLLLASPALAGAELTLKDGTVLSGTDLELKGDVYVLHTSSTRPSPSPGSS